MKLIAIETPRNDVKYARQCIVDCAIRGEQPYICGTPEYTVVYTDLGITDEMKAGIRDAHAARRKVLFRTLSGKWPTISFG